MNLITISAADGDGGGDGFETAYFLEAFGPLLLTLPVGLEPGAWWSALHSVRVGPPLPLDVLAIFLGGMLSRFLRLMLRNLLCWTGEQNNKQRDDIGGRVDAIR